MAEINKTLNRQLRKGRVRAKVFGTAERPRLSVTISNVHVSAQIINDTESKTLVAATTVGSKISGSMTEKAEKVGQEIAKKAKKAGISQVVFDRNGKKYGKRLAALADAARKEGMDF